MLLEDVGRMSVQYVGHFLLLFELFWMLIKGTDRQCPLASVQWASDRGMLTFLLVFPFRSTALIHKALFVWTNVHRAVPFTDQMTLSLFYSVLTFRMFGQTCCSNIQPVSVVLLDYLTKTVSLCLLMSSAAVNRVPVLGLEGEPGLWRAQPHSAGEQEAGQGSGKPVTQWVAKALLHAPWAVFNAS